MQLLTTYSTPLSIADIPTPKFAIGQYLHFPNEGVQLCIGMYHCSLPDEEGWWYLFDEPGFGVSGSHETQVSQ